jgi:hypothetical protein
MELREAPWKVYLDAVEPVDPVFKLSQHIETSQAFFKSIPLVKVDFAYAPEKWTIKEVLGHITDANLIFLYRLVCIARGEVKSLPGFDENTYVEQAGFGNALWEDLLQAHRGIAQATKALIANFDTATWNRIGTANDLRITPLEMLRVSIGHERHHIKVLRERYNPA